MTDGFMSWVMRTTARVWWTVGEKSSCFPPTDSVMKLLPDVMKTSGHWYHHCNHCEVIHSSFCRYLCCFSLSSSLPTSSPLPHWLQWNLPHVTVQTAMILLQIQLNSIQLSCFRDSNKPEDIPNNWFCISIVPTISIKTAPWSSDNISTIWRLIGFNSGSTSDQ